MQQQETLLSDFSVSLFENPWHDVVSALPNFIF